MGTEYPNNSYKYREKMKDQAEKKITPVAQGKVKKKSEVRKLADVFIAEDINSVKSYILTDVVIPAVANAIEDVVVKGIRMILRGETEPHRKRTNGDFIDYRRVSSGARDSRRDESRSRSNNRFNLDDIWFDSRGEAQMVLDRMEDIIAEYGFVTINELYDIGNLGTPPHTSTKFGWSNLRDAGVTRAMDGYKLYLPRAIYLD